MHKLKPLGDRILVKRSEQEVKTESGLYVPETAKEKAQTGIVIAVGSGRRDKDGNLIPLEVKVNDVVYFGKYAGTETEKDCLIISENEVLGILEQ